MMPTVRYKTEVDLALLDARHRAYARVEDRIRAHLVTPPRAACHATVSRATPCAWADIGEGPNGSPCWTTTIVGCSRKSRHDRKLCQGRNAIGRAPAVDLDGCVTWRRQEAPAADEGSRGSSV